MDVTKEERGKTRKSMMAREAFETFVNLHVVYLMSFVVMVNGWALDTIESCRDQHGITDIDAVCRVGHDNAFDKSEIIISQILSRLFRPPIPRMSLGDANV